jgi:hypothetical protein
MIATGDLDGSGEDDVIIDFGASGIWVYYNNTTWTKLHKSGAEIIVTGAVAKMTSSQTLGHRAYGYITTIPHGQSFTNQALR